MNSYKLQLITLNKNVPLMTLLLKLVVILTHYTSLLLVSIRHIVGVEENGVPLVFSVIPKQQMEDGQ